MSSSSTQPEPALGASAAAPPLAPEQQRMLLNVAWLAIILGIVIELLPLLVSGVLSAAPQVRVIVADLSSNVTWAFLVCLGIAFGQVARESIQPNATALAGFLAEPVAFISARSLHKGVLSALSVAGHTTGPNPWLIGGLKALEYRCLGYLLARLLTSKRAQWPSFVERGLSIALIFTPALLVAFASTSHPVPTATALTTEGLNEFIFPIGCSLVIFVGGAWAKRFAH